MKVRGLAFIMGASVVAMLIVASPRVFAADYANQAPMSCASQGRWTQRALKQTHNIRDYVEKLKGFAECKGIDGLSAIAQSEEDSFGMPDDADAADSGLGDSVDELPTHLSALLDSAQSFVSDSSVSDGARASVFQAMFQQNVYSGLYQSARNSQNDAASRYGATMRNASNYLEQLTNMIPQYNQCFMKHADQGAALLASVVNLTASYASAGDGVVNTLGNSINRFLKMIRESHLTGILGHLSQAEFRNSISCLIETTTENYCSVMDAQHLAKTANENYGIALTDDPSNPNFAHPLAGFYVLTQHLPNVNQWIQRLQLGVEPHWTTDAELQNKTIDITYGFTKASKDLIGLFSEERFNYINTINKNDMTAKKAAVLHLLQLLVRTLTYGSGGNKDSVNEGDSLNQFVTQTVIPAVIPFYLLGQGKDTIPARVANNQPGQMVMPWDSYLKGNGNFIDPDGKSNGFDNPDALLNTIGGNLQSLLAEAQLKANDFYRTRLIVNQPNLVVQSLVGLPRSVRASFIVIDNYIMNLETRMLSSGYLKPGSDELKSIGQMNVTHYHIRTILDAYDKLNFVKDMPIHTDPNWQAADKPYQDIVATAYDQLDIVHQRDSYLMTAVTNYVDLDYMFRTRHGIDLTPYEQDLLTVSANNLTDLLTSVHGIAPAELQNDLANADNINEANLTALEDTFYDNLKPIMDEIYATVTAGDVSDRGLRHMSKSRLGDDVSGNGVAQRDNPGASWMPSWFQGLLRWALHPDEYPFHLSLRGTTRPQQDDSYDDQAYLLSKLCVQTLAFVKRDDFKSLCMKLYDGKGAMLYSPLTSGGGALPPKDTRDFNLNLSYATAINAPRSADKRSQANRDFVQNATCAYRNWMRRNVAYFLTQDLKNGANTPNSDLQDDADHATPAPMTGPVAPGAAAAQTNTNAPTGGPATAQTRDRVHFHLVKDEPQ